MPWDCHDTRLGSPPSLLSGHNGLVAVSTESRVLSVLHPRGTVEGQGWSVLWAREGAGGSAHGAGGSHSAVASRSGTMFGATRLHPT